MDISDLVQQDAMRKAALCEELVARAEREFALMETARRASEGVATAAASLNSLEALQHRINPALKASDTLIKSFSNWSDSVADMYSRQIAGLDSVAAATFANWKHYDGSAFDRVARALHSTLFDCIENPATKILRDIQGMQDAVRSITEQFADDLFIDLELHLIDQGWYLSIDLPGSVAIDLADLHDEQKFDEIEQWLRNFYRQKLDYVETDMLAAFPRRARFLQPAFAAHRRQEYALSIPVFLSQSDGISADLWNENFFRVRRSNRRIDRMLEKGDLSLSATVLRHLYEQGCLRASFRSESRSNTFNRHAILHGTNLEYDTEENSLRCIALLEFLMALQPLFTPQPTSSSEN